MARERWSCVNCSSTVRWRSIIHVLSTELFGESLALCDFPTKKDIYGVGLSDWRGYANPLQKRLAYTNTFYHKAPFLDIANIEKSQENLYDFIISSDVFEHVCPPVSRVFENSYRLLKPGGVLILTVPYIEGETAEHFPNVREFSVVRRAGQYVLLGMTPDGRTEEFNDLIFHGGPGTTVEFRVFGEDALARECKNAGFDPVRIHSESLEEFGIVWISYDPEKAGYFPNIQGLDAPPWALVKPIQ
ncbi:MAG TPA: methyltransferase domain-containing protein [Terracidiphilus sp.]|nr:methyltransferase domain-containing protein [Terracidiphilus sp.]